MAVADQPLALHVEVVLADRFVAEWIAFAAEHAATARDVREDSVPAWRRMRERAVRGELDVQVFGSGHDVAHRAADSIERARDDLDPGAAGAVIVGISVAFTSR